MSGDFRRWLDRVPCEEVVLVAGNHDQSIEAFSVPDGLRCHYLQDSGVELHGLRIWGTPGATALATAHMSAPQR